MENLALVNANTARHMLRVNPQDLARAQVDRADAVLIMCNKTPSDAREEDLRNVMTCLAVGQYNQMIGRASSVPGMPTLSGWLMRCFSRGLDKIQKVQQDTCITAYVAVCSHQIIG